jgi:hypothetical protein
MNTEFEYYYNNVPGKGLCRNNLIYTSLISKDKKTFVQWYHNDTDYHKGQNQVIDPDLMEEKWEREVKFLTVMNNSFPMHIPQILDIDYVQKKIYLNIDGSDFWEQAGCLTENYSKVLPNWEEQMLEIIQAHKSLNLYKYSMHPSSYFIVDGKLKSINYFFTYHYDEGSISIEKHQSHLSEDRKANLKQTVESLGMNWTAPAPLNQLEKLCWMSFRTNYPDNFVSRVNECIK